MAPKNQASPAVEEPEDVTPEEPEADGADETPDWQAERASLLADIRRESKAAFEELLSELDGEAILDGGDNGEPGPGPTRTAAAGRSSGNGRGRGGAATPPAAPAAKSYLGFLFGQRRP